MPSAVKFASIITVWLIRATLLPSQTLDHPLRVGGDVKAPSFTRVPDLALPDVPYKK